MNMISRRDLLALGSLAVAPLALADSRKAASPVINEPILKVLGRFIAGYCEAMNAPGLTLGLVSVDGMPVTSAYGYADRSARTPVRTSDLFEIGSITKSFAALTILQLVDEGKVDLNTPIQRYLPWLPMETDFGDITVHHLLTHSSGMPAEGSLFRTDPGQPVRQTCAPGSHFYYSNWGYDVLGHLIQAVDGRSWPAAVAARILRPLGMTDTLPATTSAARQRIVKSYTPLHDDRPYLRHGPLTSAGNLTMTAASGSIASTPHDMALYLQMILNRGKALNRRIVSEDSFRLFSTPHIPAAEFGPSAFYGYGIAVDTLDGHTRLRHTGGMTSFMSAMQIDLQSGCAAFASINAQLGYRPNPVAQFALQLMRAQQEGRALPTMPAFDETAMLERAAEYEGVYQGPNGAQVTVTARAGRLTLRAHDRDIPLQHSEGDTFIADAAEFALFRLVFGRSADASVSTSSVAAATHGAAPVSAPPVVDLSYGADWYAHSRHPRPVRMAPREELDKYVGIYYCDSAWQGVQRIVQRQGELWVGGSDPLVAVGDGVFRVSRENWCPDRVSFKFFPGGLAQVMYAGGAAFERIPGESA